MHATRSLDWLVKERLRQWPQSPPGARASVSWLRGRPSDEHVHGHPFLKLPGSAYWRTLPDGLWLNFGGTPGDAYVDIFAVEACSSVQNLLDKRFRFAPSTHSLLAVCPVEWLKAPVTPNDPIPRWRVTGLLSGEPVSPLVLPVRDMHVLYGLKRRHYQGFALHHLPHAHEYVTPMEVLTAEDGDKNPALQAWLARACAAANFFDPTDLGECAGASG